MTIRAASTLTAVALTYEPGELDTLTRTVWGEARGEADAGRVAVAWWGGSIGAVCRKPRQFSCWNEEDPNCAKLTALAVDDPLYQHILGLCRDVLAGRVPDSTGGADHYQVIGTGAAWSHGKKPSAIIGRHAFYRLGPNA